MVTINQTFIIRYLTTMKIQFKYMLMAAAAAVLSAGTISCDEGGLDDLEGIYAAPSQATVTGATLADKTKEGNLRTFTLSLSSSEGANINIALVCNDFYIKSNTYTLKEAASAKNGNFVSGISTINGSAIVDGGLVIEQNGDDYTVKKSALFTADGKAYIVNGQFSMSFDPDDPTAVNQLKSVVPNGDGTVTVTFTTGGYTEELNMNTWQMEYRGEGFDFQIVFNCPDGKLHAGTYAPGSGYVAGRQDMVDWGWGPMPMDAGTIWYTIANGAKTATYITSGDIVVKKDGPMYSVLIDQGKGGVYAEYKGAISDLDPDGGSGNVELMSSCLGVTNWASFGWGINFIDISLANGDVQASFDPATQQTTYTGTGLMLQVEPYSEDGTLTRGEYTIAPQGAPGVCIAGAENMFAPGTPSGCYIRKVENGVLGEWTYITEGTVTIEGEGDSTKITLVTGDSTYMFTGNLGL